MGASSRVSAPLLGRGWFRLAARVFSSALLIGCFVSTLAWAQAGAGTADLRAGHRLIVKFKGQGPHSLDECAETLFRQGRAFRSATSDGSDSIDRLGRRFGIRRVRSLFRRPNGRPLAEQRRAMRRRFDGRARAGAVGRRALAAAASVPDLSHIYLLELGEDVSPDEAVALYRGDAHVAYAQRDHAHRLDVLPDDPFLHSSGSWGQTFDDLWGLYRIRAPEAWAISRGEGVVVAVVDTGLDYHHPDIAGNVWLNPGEDLNGNGRVDESDWNGVDDDGNGFIDDLRGFDFANSLDADQDGYYDGPDDISDPDPFDDYGHGTHVAGTIAAIAGNGIGIAGVAPRARIMPLKGFTADGEGLDSVLWRAVLYAAENGATVVNNSWSCSPSCPRNPLAEDVVETVHAMGVVIVTSAGNRSSDVVFNSPENMRETLTVASSGQDDRPSRTFTNGGWLIDVAAPGGGPAEDRSVPFSRRNILSLRSSTDADSEIFSVAGDYLRMAGTSMAAPHVSGVVALLQSARPELDYEAIRRILRQSAVDLGPVGHDREMGAGRLDALAALTYGPLPDLSAAITSPLPDSVFRPDVGVIGIRGRAAGADLLDFSLSYGPGRDPAEWFPITLTSAAPIREGLLGEWAVDDLEEGTYVVKLEVRSRNGAIYSEFLPLSLERNRFAQYSHSAAHARAPAVSGDLVVWQSRNDRRGAGWAAGDLDLFASDLSTGLEYALQTGPGDQKSASVSRRLVSWADTRSGSGRPEVFACLLDRRAGACTEFPVTPAGSWSPNPASAAGRVFWLDSGSSAPGVHGCLPDSRGGGCDGYALDLPAAGRSDLRTDGRSLVWTEVGAGFHFAICEVDPASGQCPATRFADSIFSYSSPAVSGRLVAWVDFAPGRNPLQICQLDPATGACPPVLVAEGVLDTTPRLSGNRLVWHASSGDEAGDIFFCEFDAARRRCPVQRLTAQMAEQREAVIDGARIVWEDERGGAAQIYGLELPTLFPIRNRRVREGALLRIPVFATDPAGGAMRVEAETAGAQSLEELGARFIEWRSRGGRRRSGGVLRWRPTFDQAGRYLITFSATAEGGIVTRKTIGVRVTDVIRPPVPWFEQFLSRLVRLWRQLLVREHASTALRSGAS